MNSIPNAGEITRQNLEHRALQAWTRQRRRRIQEHSREVLHKPGSILKFQDGAYKVMGDGSYRKIDLPPETPAAES